MKLRPITFIILFLLAGCASQMAKLSIDQAPSDLKLPTETRELRTKAGNGDLDAMFELGVYYAEAYDDTRDKNPHAMFWLGLAAQKGHVWAQNEMGVTYRDPRFGEIVDFKKALYWFKLAAKGNDDMALYNLARMYRDGLGTKRDAEKSLEYLELAAQNNYPNAVYMLALTYKLGNGVSPNRELYIKYRDQALQAGINDYEFFKCEYQFFSDDILTNAVIQGLFHEYYHQVQSQMSFEEAILSFSDAFMQQENMQEIAEQFLVIDINVSPEVYKREIKEEKNNGIIKKLAESLSIYSDEDKKLIQFELTRVAALMGNKSAQGRIILYYKQGIGVKRNNSEANYWQSRVEN